MKIIKFEDAIKFENSEKCVGVEYPLNDSDINCAVAIINGRYPEVGYCYNEKCKELIYVVKGKGKIFLKNGKEIDFKDKDSLLIDKGEIYYWDADCEVVMPCIPAWYPEQHKLTE